MTILERGQAFRDRIRGVAQQSVWDWRRCVRCGYAATHRHGTYTRHPLTLSGRQTMRVQRYRRPGCGGTYRETTPWLVRGAWYAREVRRAAGDAADAHGAGPSRA